MAVLLSGFLREGVSCKGLRLLQLAVDGWVATTAQISAFQAGWIETLSMTESRSFVVWRCSVAFLGLRGFCIGQEVMGSEATVQTFEHQTAMGLLRQGRESSLPHGWIWCSVLCLICVTMCDGCLVPGPSQYAARSGDTARKFLRRWSAYIGRTDVTCSHQLR